jgi:hypothetical protein
MAHRLAPSIHPIIINAIGEKEDVPYENTRRFPELKQRSLHRSLKTGGCWDHDESIPGPDWVPDSALPARPITIRSIIPEKAPGTENPGPGTYSVPVEAGRNSEPKFTMKGPSDRDHWLPKSGGENPGPGYYEIKPGNDWPKWTIGERTLQKIREQRAKTTMAALRSSAPALRHASTL